MMMKSFQRYIRAFLLALKMTARGERPPQPVQHPLVPWTRQLSALVEEVYEAAEREGLDKSARQTLKVKVDGRWMSVETLLATMRFHAAQEYPSLLRTGTSQRILNVIYASNMNEGYWVGRIAELESLQKPALKSALERLATHLSQIPSP